MVYGNSLCVLVKYLDGMFDEEVFGLNIFIGVLLVYELDENLKFIFKEYLGDVDVIKVMMDVVVK